MRETTARNFALLGAWLFLLVGACVIYACGAEEDSAESEEHWHDRYVRDHCERCPECCTVSLWAAADEVDDGDHCEGCPGFDCLCVQDSRGAWALNATIGDVHENPVSECFARRYSWLSLGWSDEQLAHYCESAPEGF